MKIKTFKREKLGTYRNIDGARSFSPNFDDWRIEFEQLMKEGMEYRIKMKVELWVMEDEE